MPMTYEERKKKAKDIPLDDSGLARNAANKLISREQRMNKMIDEYTGYDTPEEKPADKPKSKIKAKDNTKRAK